MTLPEVASAQLHPAPPESYTVFLAGCNFKCLNCQNWTISTYPDQPGGTRGFVEPEELAAECVRALRSPSGKAMGADRIFFSGGESTIHLPYIERVVTYARQLDPQIKVNFDTNGLLTEDSLRRVFSFATSITYDLKAYHDEVFRALTGAPVAPVLRNARIIGTTAKDQLWEFRILVIPGINETDIRPLCQFIAGMDTCLPVCFLCFRPNFVLEHHPGAASELMERCVKIASDCGLENVHWSGFPGLPGESKPICDEVQAHYGNENARLAASYAHAAGCTTHPRDCGACPQNQNCALKSYRPRIVT
jgi:pyruvate formate lyase activating enzyme